jgi:membrane-bound serine protease (ClpP class)
LFILIASKFYIFYPQFRKPRIGREEMIGASGRVIKELNPEGQVKIKGELWKARTIENEISKGEKIEIVNMKGLKLIVRQVKDYGKKHMD